MSSATGVETARHGTRLPWGDILLSAIAAVSWALIGMAGTAALGLHLLRADTAGSLGPMTAAVVALGAGGSVSPSGDVSAFGLKGAQAHTAIEITPLGVSLVGALLLSWFFLRSLRTAGVVIAPAELLARAGAVLALFVAMLGGLAWAGHDVITIDGGSLGLDQLPGAGGGGGGGGGVSIPGLGDLGDIGGLLPDRIGDLIHAKAAVGFTVDTAPTVLGGLGWCAGTLLIALLASRRTPLPSGWEAVHRVVRPAVSALVTVLLVAVGAGLAAAAYAAIGDDHPARIAGAALLGAPNGVWLGVPIGLFVPWDGRATGALVGLLPDPLDKLLGPGSGQSVTLGRLADLDGRVWLLAVAAALMLLLAGVLTAVRTPAEAGSGAVGLVGRCALRLGVATALTLPLLAWLADVSVDASLSVLGFDAFGAGVQLHGHLGMALLLGAAWGAAAGAAGALLALAFGAAGRGAAVLALGDAAGGGAGAGTGAGSGADAGAGPGLVGHARPSGSPGRAGSSGPYAPGTPYRPPNPDTNPYLRIPEGLREPEDAKGAYGPGEESASGDVGDVYGSPTIARPVGPPPPPPPPSSPPPPLPPRGKRKGRP
ncbi:streptophobe family protein [Streptomyces sp. NPDC046915]|uniref:streptophobe family protein n=1 Tax=Streptomyces sp. NPDC046915 TaxID=3155257 RepID=UPI0033D1F939